MRKPTTRDAGRIVRVFPEFVAAIAAAAVATGFFGGLHPVFDTVAQFRAHAALILGLAAILLAVRGRIAASLASLLVAALGLYSVAPFMLAAPPTNAGLSDAPRYTLLQTNLRWDAPSHAQTLSLIARLRPDVVTAQEVTSGWKADFERLRSAYPYQAFCTEPFRHGDTAILSRRPFVETNEQGDERAICRNDERFSARTIDFNGFPVTVGSQHLRWPWPGGQPRMVDALLPTLAGLDDPLIVAGDFNAAPWTDGIRRYAEASGTRVVGGLGPSWITGLLPAALARYAGLPIDNVLVSDGIEVLGARTLPGTDSDHLPVLLTFTMRFALPEQPDVRSAGRR